MDNEELVRYLKANGWEPRPYSGSWHNYRCVAVEADSLDHIFELGFELGQEGISPGAPRYNDLPGAPSYGHSFILYWPEMEWPGMKEAVGFVVVKMTYAYSGDDPESAFQGVVAEMDYSMTLDEEGRKILDTKIDAFSTGGPFRDRSLDR